MIGAIVTRNDGFERRARVMPWGIEVQLWRLVETVTLPGSAATLPINTLFPDPDVGAIPSPRPDDDKTLENLLDGSNDEDSVELVYGEEDEAASDRKAAPEGQEGRGPNGR